MRVGEHSRAGRPDGSSSANGNPPGQDDRVQPACQHAGANTPGLELTRAWRVTCTLQRPAIGLEKGRSELGVAGCDGLEGGDHFLLIRHGDPRVKSACRPRS